MRNRFPRPRLGKQSVPQRLIMLPPAQETPNDCAADRGRSAAINAASMSSVPEPHMGSSRAPPCAAIVGQPARSRMAAARFSFSGRRQSPLTVPAPMQRLSGQVQARGCMVLQQVGVDPDIRLRGLHRWLVPPAVRGNWSTIASLTLSAPKWLWLICDLEALNSNCKAVGYTEMFRPGDAPHTVVQRFRRRCGKISQRQQDRYARPETGPVRCLQGTCERSTDACETSQHPDAAPPASSCSTRMGAVAVL